MDRERAPGELAGLDQMEQVVSNLFLAQLVGPAVVVLGQSRDGV
jgi:hypothetical protein